MLQIFKEGGYTMRHILAVAVLGASLALSASAALADGLNGNHTPYDTSGQFVGTVSSAMETPSVFAGNQTATSAVPSVGGSNNRADR